MTVRLAEPFGLRPVANDLIGDEGLALAAGAASFLEAYINGIPEGYSVRLEVDRPRRGRDEVTLEVTRERSGSVAFRLVWKDTDDFELLSVMATPIF